MPIPTPTPIETKNEFIDRCMNDEVMKTDFPDNMQRLAVCSVSYDKTKLEIKNKTKKNV
jgi:hypothetical protein